MKGFIFYSILEITVLIFDILGAYANYIAGHYIWAMILSFCAGIVLSSITVVTVGHFKE